MVEKLIEWQNAEGSDWRMLNVVVYCGSQQIV